jgi:WXG100 family type VII secretion target
MADVGGDLATLGQLKRDLDDSAARAEQVKSTLDRSVGAAVWRGPNADNFRSAWQEFSPTFTRLQQALSDASTDVRNQHNNLAAAVGSSEAI